MSVSLGKTYVIFRQNRGLGKTALDQTLSVSGETASAEKASNQTASERTSVSHTLSEKKLSERNEGAVD